MTQWLLTAEADKIQHLVFRSSHLREVVGGSQLLTRFCDDATSKLRRKKPFADEPIDVIVADGGSFTFNFGGDSPEVARRFGQALAQLYREATGSTMTVALPEPWSGAPGDFAAANRQARQKLALAKRQGRPAEASEHWPYTAFCASCGMGLANTHETLHPADRPNYLCQSCLRKRDERENEGTEFLGKFMQAVVGADARRLQWPKEADDLAEWDPRSYVAYLVADGNGMGSIFRKCADADRMRHLSDNLTHKVRAALAEPTRAMMKRASSSAQWLVPALPLILGGDDIFLLLPAPYALDFARRFCLAYEEQMHAVLRDVIGPDAPKPTISAAVVICKSKYPHTLAHRRGEELLKEAKRMAKALPFEYPGHAYSVVNFDLILGHRVADAGATKGDEYRPTLKPYWVTQEPLPEHAGLPIDLLIQSRWQLKDLPKRRLAQLRTLFEPRYLPTNGSDNPLGRWQAGLEKTCSQVARSKEMAKTLRDVERRLGGNSQGNWRHVNRPGSGPERSDQSFFGHGLPDLIQMWDFCFDLEHDRSDYEPKE